MMTQPWVVRETYGYIWVQRQGYCENIPYAAFLDPRVCYKIDTVDDANDLADLLNDRDRLLTACEAVVDNRCIDHDEDEEDPDTCDVCRQLHMIRAAVRTARKEPTVC